MMIKNLSSSYKVRMNFSTTISLKCLPQKLSILPSLIEQVLANLKQRELRGQGLDYIH